MDKRLAILLIALHSFSRYRVGASKLSLPVQTNTFKQSAENQVLFRGGALSAPSPASSKEKKKKSKKAESRPAKIAIAGAMGKDSTEALGDAIR